MYLNLEKKAKSSYAAIDCKGNEISYGELCDAVNKIAMVCEPRTIVFCFCQNTIDMLIGYLGFIEGKVVPLLLSSSIDDSLIEDLYKIYHPQYVYAPKRILEEGGKEVYSQGEYALYRTDNDKYQLNKDLALLMTTSGSTGSPKLVRYTRHNLEVNAKNVALAFEWTEQERPLIDLHMEYTMGLNVINTHLFVGATLLMTTDNIMSGEYWDFLMKHEATNITGVPFSYELMLKLRFLKMNIPYLTTLAQGGGKLSDNDFKKLATYAAENGKRFIATFGTTETSARMTMLPPEMALDKVGSIGKAIPDGELFLIDDSGNVIETPDTEGELCYRGPNVTMGYAQGPEDLMKDDEFQGEYHTGDLAKKDEDGFYYITGRKGRFLKLTGHRVSLDQCQSLIEGAFDTECACSGTDQGMKIYVTCEGRNDEIVDMISQKLNLFSSLFTVFEVDSIPRNETGKILYNKLDKM